MKVEIIFFQFYHRTTKCSIYFGGFKPVGFTTLRSLQHEIECGFKVSECWAVHSNFNGWDFLGVVIIWNWNSRSLNLFRDMYLLSNITVGCLSHWKIRCYFSSQSSFTWDLSPNRCTLALIGTSVTLTPRPGRARIRTRKFPFRKLVPYHILNFFSTTFAEGKKISRE